MPEFWGRLKITGAIKDGIKEKQKQLNPGTSDWAG
jgi:hypothetical protein